VALAQVNGAGQRIVRYRVFTRTDGSLQVEALTSSGWQFYSFWATPAIFSNPSRGNLVDVLLATGVQRTYRGRIFANWKVSTSATSPTLTPVNVLPMES